MNDGRKVETVKSEQPCNALILDILANQRPITDIREDHRLFARRRARKAEETRFRKGKNAEHQVLDILTQLGFPATLQNCHSPFDILCRGARVEVKYSSLTCTYWAFNIHRHGKVNEADVDVYVLVCGPGRVTECTYFLVIPAPLEAPVFYASPRTLRTIHRQYLNRWEFIIRRES